MDSDVPDVPADRAHADGPVQERPDPADCEPQPRRCRNAGRSVPEPVQVPEPVDGGSEVMPDIAGAIIIAVWIAQSQATAILRRNKYITKLRHYLVDGV